MNDFIFLVKVNQIATDIDILFYQTIQSKLLISLSIVGALLIIAKMQGNRQMRAYINKTPPSI